MFDLWANSWRNSKASGDVIMVRFADDSARWMPLFKPVKVRHRELTVDPISTSTGVIG